MMARYNGEYEEYFLYYTSRGKVAAASSEVFEVRRGSDGRFGANRLRNKLT